MIEIDRKTPGEIQLDMAEKIRSIRKRKGLSQEKLAKKSGVSLGSLKRFESSGEISLRSLIKISIALGIDDELIHIFENVPFSSIEEIIRLQKMDKYASRHTKL